MPDPAAPPPDPCLQGQERTKFVFQGVHETICFGPAATGWREDEETVNQIVFIGRDLDRKVRAAPGRWALGVSSRAAQPQPCRQRAAKCDSRRAQPLCERARMRCPSSPRPPPPAPPAGAG